MFDDKISNGVLAVLLDSVDDEAISMGTAAKSGIKGKTSRFYFRMYGDGQPAIRQCWACPTL